MTKKDLSKQMKKEFAKFGFKKLNGKGDSYYTNSTRDKVFKPIASNKLEDVTDGYISKRAAAEMIGISADEMHNITRFKIKPIYRDGKPLVKYTDVVKYFKAHPPKKKDIVWGSINIQNGEPLFALVGYDHMYATTLDGNIVDLTEGYALSNTPEKDGYVNVSVYKDGKRIGKYAHDLVAETQLENKRFKMFPDAKWEVHHIHIGHE